MSHNPSRSPAFGGELIVTGKGEVVIDDVVSHSPKMFKHPHRYVSVEFDPHRHLSPPCAGHDVPDCLNWELIIFRHPHHGKEELRLRINWNVNRTRAIVWTIKTPSR